MMSLHQVTALCVKRERRGVELGGAGVESSREAGRGWSSVYALTHSREFMRLRRGSQVRSE